MICKKCAEAAKKNRVEMDVSPDTILFRYKQHPKNCNCPCQHRHGPWEKMFSVEKPNEKNS